MTRDTKRMLYLGGGVALVGLLGFGFYEMTRPKTTVTPSGPSTTAGGSAPVLSGLTVNLAPGATSFSAAPGTPLSLVLPPGATWVSITSQAGGGGALPILSQGSSSPATYVVTVSDTLMITWLLAGKTQTATLGITATALPLTTG